MTFGVWKSLIHAGWGRRIRTPANGSRVHGPTARRSPSRESQKRARQQNLLGGLPIILFPTIQGLLRGQALLFFTTSPVQCQEEPLPRHNSRSLSENPISSLTVLKKTEAAGKCSDARHPSLFKPQAQILRNESRLKSGRSDDQPSPRLRPDKSAGQENEDNAADGRFPAAS